MIPQSGTHQIRTHGDDDLEVLGLGAGILAPSGTDARRVTGMEAAPPDHILPRAGQPPDGEHDHRTEFQS